MEPKRLKIILLRSMLALVVCVVILVVGGILWISYEWNIGSYNSFAEYTSMDGDNHITIKARDPVWPFGSQDFKIILQGKECGKQTITTKLSNDGKSSQDGEEVKTEFIDNSHAVIVFYGEEQNPEIIEIFFDKQNETIEIDRMEKVPDVT